MKQITPFLWFDTQAEEAARFYVSIFPNSKILNVSRYGDEAAKVSGMPEGMVMTVEFLLDGQPFTVLNGGPTFKFSEAVSFVVHCTSQEQVDYYWDAFTKDGGEEGQCGWLKDRFGVSWQVVPDALQHFINSKDATKAEAAMKAMLKMKKIIIKDLERAAKT